jgi:hypothetical protein
MIEIRESSLSVPPFQNGMDTFDAAIGCAKESMEIRGNVDLESSQVVFSYV